MFSLQATPEMFEKATEAEKLAAARPVPERSDSAVRRFFRNPAGALSAAVLLAMLAVIILTPLVVPYGYSDSVVINGARDGTAANLAPMAWSENELEYMRQTGCRLFPHLFGTDALARDYFVRVVRGAGVSLFVGLFAAAIVALIGSVYGAASAMAGGRADMIMMRIVDVVYSLPDLLIIILLSVVLDKTLGSSGALSSSLGTGVISMFIVFGCLYWVGAARMVRSRVATLKNCGYVLASRSLGASNARILFSDILPNCSSLIIVTAALEVPTAIFTESYLSFVGLGVRAPMPSLGSLASAALGGIQAYPMRLVFPAAAICIIVLALNAFGDALQDALDPKA
jgi:oligopeptide transport system permease protein